MFGVSVRVRLVCERPSRGHDRHPRTLADTRRQPRTAADTRGQKTFRPMKSLNIKSAEMFYMKILRHICLAAAACLLAACSGTHGSDTRHKALPDTLRVATLYSPTTYFIYRDEPMGYDYSLVNDFAEAKGMVLDLRVARSMSEAVAMLDSGSVDLLACGVPVTSQFKGRVVACGPELLTTQVLVQPRVKGEPAITDVTIHNLHNIYIL